MGACRLGSRGSILLILITAAAALGSAICACCGARAEGRARGLRPASIAFNGHARR